MLFSQTVEYALRAMVMLADRPDEPQVTVNQRFEVYFPEKRPFFLENASFFATPMQLVFTRRIADPEYGVRLTGKLGPWALGTLFANDKSPGGSVSPTDPLSGEKAYYTVLRVNRDIGKESTLGFIYTDREQGTAPVEEPRARGIRPAVAREATP